MTYKDLRDKLLFRIEGGSVQVTCSCSEVIPCAADQRQREHNVLQNDTESRPDL